MLRGLGRIGGRGLVDGSDWFEMYLNVRFMDLPDMLGGSWNGNEEVGTSCL